jgi:hypothetical protein
MVAKMNTGDFKADCNTFERWYVRSYGQVRKGLIARRSGIGGGRKSEKQLCLEGLAEGGEKAAPIGFRQKIKLFFITIWKGLWPCLLRFTFTTWPRAELSSGATRTPSLTEDARLSPGGKGATSYAEVLEAKVKDLLARAEAIKAAVTK